VTEAPARFDLLSAPMARDRAEGWRYVRAAGPVLFSNNRYLLTRREDVEWALRNPELFSSREAFAMMHSPLPLVPIAFDPPEHTRYRKILQPFFSPRALASLLPSLQSQIDELIDGIAAKSECEAIAELAIPYPSTVFLALFGLPLEDRERLITWKDTVIGLADTGGSIENRDPGPALELFSYLVEHVGRKRADPGDDVLSHVLTADDALTDEEAIGLSFLFVLAGLDTVTAAIGFALNHLATHPDLRRRLIDDPGLVPTFAEEIVRLEPPAYMVPRVATEDVVISGCPVPKGSEVVICLGAANREPSEENPTPDSVELDAVRRHWGFGGGPHRCVGAHLARMELKLVITAWHSRIPEYRTPPGFEAEVNWPRATFGLDRLPLLLG
jgi:cytochrome P450